MEQKQYFNSIQEAKDFLEDKKVKQVDEVFTCDGNALEFKDNKIYSKVGDRTKEYSLTPTAEAQLLNRCKIPVNFANRIPQDLLENNVNRLFPKQSLLFRTESDKIRAILTPRYRPINHLDLIDGLKKVTANFSVNKLFITDDFMRWSVLSEKRIGHEIGQVVQTGFEGVNGETGLYQLSRSLFSLKIVCLNQMVMVDQKFSYCTRHIKDKDIVLKDYFDISCADNTILAQYKQASEEVISDKIINNVKLFIERFITEPDDIEDFLTKKRADSGQIMRKIDIIDNLTDFAKEKPEETRREIESFAGSIM
jgi:hypothetical protein